MIPLLVYFRLVCLFFAATVLNNIALNYHISIPVHTVFRSSGLAGTLLTGFLFYKKKSAERTETQSSAIGLADHDAS